MKYWLWVIFWGAQPLLFPGIFPLLALESLTPWEPPQFQVNQEAVYSLLRSNYQEPPTAPKCLLLKSMGNFNSVYSALHLPQHKKEKTHS